MFVFVGSRCSKVSVSLFNSKYPPAFTCAENGLNDDIPAPLFTVHDINTALQATVGTHATHSSQPSSRSLNSLSS